MWPCVLCIAAGRMSCQRRTYCASLQCVVVPYMQKQCSNTMQFAVKFTVCVI